MNARDKKWQVFGLTWLSYATYYLVRKNFSIVKSRLHDDVGLSVGTLASIDTIYLTMYALGQFVNGVLGDRFGAKRILVVGMLACGALSLCFGMTSSALLFVLLFGVQGFFQSTGWPNNVKAMEPWFDQSTRGKVMGFWSTNYQVGGVVASALAAFLLARYGWRSAFFVPGMLVVCVGFGLLIFLPRHHGGDTAKGKHKASQCDRIKIWRNPHVWILGLAYFCLKLIRYSLLFWLPFYLHRRLGVAEESSGYLSIVLELGGVGGAIVTGIVADRYFRTSRPQMVAPLFFGLFLSLLCYQFVGSSSLFANAMAMSAIGFFIYGPDTLISGACSQDLGGEAQTGAVAGAINGIGSVGAILQGAVTAYVTETWGWDALFSLFTALALVSAITVVFSLAVLKRQENILISSR